MGFLDKIKGKVGDAVNQHGDKIEQGIDKAAATVDDKTGGKHSDKIDQGVGKAKDTLDGLDGRNDDFGTREPDASTTPGPVPGEPTPSDPGTEPQPMPGGPTEPADPDVAPSSPEPSSPVEPGTPFEPETPTDPGVQGDPGTTDPTSEPIAEPGGDPEAPRP